MVDVRDGETWIGSSIGDQKDHTNETNVPSDQIKSYLYWRKKQNAIWHTIWGNAVWKTRKKANCTAKLWTQKSQTAGGALDNLAAKHDSNEDGDAVKRTAGEVKPTAETTAVTSIISTDKRCTKHASETYHNTVNSEFINHHISNHCWSQVRSEWEKLQAIMLNALVWQEIKSTAACIGLFKHKTTVFFLLFEESQ